jgi:hypothetical protein
VHLEQFNHTQYVHSVPSVFYQTLGTQLTFGTVYWLTVGNTHLLSFAECSISTTLVQTKHSAHNHYLMVCVCVPYILLCVTFLQHSVEIKLTVEKKLVPSVFIQALGTNKHSMGINVYQVFVPQHSVPNKHLVYI